jgi:hypothetical protein
MSILTEIDGLDEAESYFKAVPAQAKKAASLAINEVIARQGLKLVRDEMYSQVNFPKGYLKGDRLSPVRFATASNLEGVIRARKRATSLARFAGAGTPIGSGGKTGVTVSVRNGKSTFLRQAWLVRLKRGASLSEDQYNIGLAVRVKQGDRINNKFSKHKSWLVPGRVALLYGPSVDQVFKDVAEDNGQQILGILSTEFFRQLERLL